jgi:hypothetical protein
LGQNPNSCNIPAGDRHDLAGISLLFDRVVALDATNVFPKVFFVLRYISTDTGLFVKVASLLGAGNCLAKGLTSSLRCVLHLFAFFFALNLSSKAKRAGIFADAE